MVDRVWQDLLKPQLDKWLKRNPPPKKPLVNEKDDHTPSSDSDADDGKN